MAAGSLNLGEIVRNQQERGLWFIFDNFGFMIVPFMVYCIAAIAETNRAPFDLPEAESELVAGFHTEYSGIRWGLYMLSEYANMYVVGSVAVTLFLGGWLRPFPSVSWLHYPLDYGVPFLLLAGTGIYCFPLASRLPDRPRAIGLRAVGLVMLALGALFLVPVVNDRIAPLYWFFFKLASLIYAMIWFRGTFPRYRYDQLMNIGWKVMIPTALGAILVNAIIGVARL
jgi:NADH-quinone oxidoreductase subunit H